MNAPSTAFVVDPDNPQLPDDFPVPSGEGGEVVLLVVEEAAGRAGWPARVAVELAGRWADAGRRVLLADGDLADAPLHAAVGVGNSEGIADVILHGASPGRVAQRVSERGFLFASAGTVVPDPSEAYRHPRWKTVLAAFRESGTAFLLYLPAQDVAPDLLGEGDRLIRMAAGPPAGEPEPGVTLIHGGGAEVSGEDPAASEPAPAVEVGVEGEPEAAWAGGEADSDPELEIGDQPRPGEEVAQASPTGAEEEGTEPVGLAGAQAEESASVEGETALTEPPPTPRSQAKGSRRTGEGSRVRVVLLLILLLVAALAFLGEWLGFFDLPGFAGVLGSFGSHPTGSG